jgi:DNA-binding Lrp family transcriptional regulator
VERGSRTTGRATPDGRVGSGNGSGSQTDSFQIAVPLDALNRRIVAALQISPRATWRQIAAAVDSTETTVKRRAERMIESGTVRVTLMEAALPGFPVLLQLNCELSRGMEVAHALADRDDIRFVALVTGPTDVVAEMIVASNQRLADIIINELPAISGILATTTETVLRTFKTSYDWASDLLGGRASLLTPAVDPYQQVSSAAGHDEVSRRLVAELRRDGRLSYTDLAQRCGITESIARYRLKHLLTRGGVRPVTLIDPHLLGFDTEMLLWLRVELVRREEVAAALSARREVRYVSVTSGYSDMVCEVILHSQADVYDFSTEVLAKLPGVQHVNMASELLTLKRAYARLDGTLAVLAPERTVMVEGRREHVRQ